MRRSRTALLATAGRLIAPALFFVMLLVFFIGVHSAEKSAVLRQRQALGDAARRYAITSYAVRGFFPDSLEAIMKSGALLYDSSKFRLEYEVFAHNVMPRIRVYWIGQ